MELYSIKTYYWKTNSRTLIYYRKNKATLVICHPAAEQMHIVFVDIQEQIA